MSRHLTLAQLGWVHEYGTRRSGRNRRVVIPARPFLVPGLMENREILKAELGKALQRILAGKQSKRDALGEIGARGQRMVQEKIRNGPFQELADITKKAKTVRGKSGDTPLIDLGNMIQHVAWEFDS